MPTLLSSVKRTGQQLIVLASFLLIPLLIFLTSLQTIQTRDKAWYGGGYDPEYAYLFNSLNMARFRLVGHIDHPGTTMQMAGGAVLEGAWLADPRGENLTQAVLSEPEHYVRILNVATSVMACLALYFLAFILYRRTHNIWYSLLLQLTPFVSGLVLFNGFTRVSQEAMQMIAAFAMATAALIWFFDHRHKNSWKYILLFGIISGFGMASKVLFAPLMIIPLVLIEPFNSKIKFGFVSVGAFVLFTLPIVRLYPNMLHWFYNLFIHSGQYGAGEKAVIDTSKYLQELLNLIKVNPVLSVIFGLSVLVLIVFLVRKLVNRGETFPSSAKLLLAVVLAQTAGYLLVAKQPKAAYLLPYESVVAINLVVLVYLLISMFGQKWMRNLTSGIILVALTFLLIPSSLAKKKSLYLTSFNPLWEQSWQAASSSSGHTAVISPNPGISPVPALNFGNAYSRRHYSAELKQLYPDFYIDDSFSGLLVDWSGKEVNFQELYTLYDGRIYYLGTPMQSDGFISSMKTLFPEFQFQKVYENEKLSIVSPYKKDNMKALRLQQVIFCGGEMPDYDGKQPATCAGFSYVGIPDTEHPFSGKASIRVAPESPYAFAVEPFIVQTGDSISVSVWSSAESELAKIVLSSVEPQGFYYTSGNVATQENKKWFLLQLNRKITADEAGKYLKVYVWNKDVGPVWFDNFRMEYYKAVKNYEE